MFIRLWIYQKSLYWSIVFYLYRQKVLDGDPKAIRFANTMPTDIKFSIVQISEIIQSGSWLGNLWEKALTNIAIPFAGDSFWKKNTFYFITFFIWRKIW